MDYIATFNNGHREKVIAHWGIKGMRWGERRWQNPDGSLTPEGRIHYGRIAKNKPDFASTSVGAIGGAAAVGGRHGGVVGAIAGGVGGALGSYAAYKVQKSQYDKANKKLKEDADRRQREYENSDEYKEYLGKLKTEGKRLDNGGAESFRKSKNKEAAQSFEESEWHKSEWAKERGLDSPDKVLGYVKKALKNYNENDPDQVVYQHMDDVFQMQEKGFITKNTFQKLYDAQLAEDSVDYANYRDTDFLDEWHNVNTSNNKKSSSDNRLSGVPSSAFDRFGLRRYQNPDGSLTPVGKARYGKDVGKSSGRYKIGSKEKAKISAGSMNAVTDALITGNSESAYRKLHNDGYRPSEIAKMLGQSTKDDGKPSGETRKWAAKYKVNKNDISSLKARQNRAQSLKSSGKTIAEIADIMGAPVSSIKDYLYEDFDSLR